MHYRMKPIIIEACQWSGNHFISPDEWIDYAVRSGVIKIDGNSLIIHTLKGEVKADPYDWIILGVKGEVYPCKPDMFEAMYEISSMKTNKNSKAEK